MADVKEPDDSGTPGTLNSLDSTATTTLPANNTTQSNSNKVGEPSIEVNDVAVKSNGASAAAGTEAEDLEKKSKVTGTLAPESKDHNGESEVQSTTVTRAKTSEPTGNEGKEKTADVVQDSSPVKESAGSRRGDSNGYRGRGGHRGGRSNDRDYKQQKPYDKPKKDYRQNVKSDLTSQAESSDPVAIRKQVEFYFSDSNLHNDKHLFDLVGGHKNHAVSIEKIHNFKRMRHFQPFPAVVAALKESKTLNVVNDDTEIQRKVPLRDFADKGIEEIQKVYEDEAMARSVYVKGFGDEKATTQFDLEAFFAEYGATNSVRLRRDQEKFFKGSVFVEFESEETAKEFLALDPKPKYNGEDLVIKSKKQYCDEKVDDIRAGRLEPTKYDQHGRPKKRYDDIEEDNRDWKERREEDRRNGFQDKRRGDRRDDRRDGGKNRGNNRGRGKYRRDDRDDRRQNNRRNDHDRGIPKVQATRDDSESVSTRSRSRSPYRNSRDADKETKNETISGKARDTNATAPPPIDVAATQIQSQTETKTDGNAASPGSPKKRKHEADGESDVQGSEKKVAVESS